MKPFDRFGASVSIDGDAVIVGSHQDFEEGKLAYQRAVQVWVTLLRSKTASFFALFVLFFSLHRVFPIVVTWHVKCLRSFALPLYALPVQVTRLFCKYSRVSVIVSAFLFWDLFFVITA